MLCWRTPRLAHDRTPAFSDTRHDRRIVWLLFDELSYYQTFEHRIPGLAMPEFDHLRSKSFFFEDLRPAASYTDVALPALFLGKGVDDIRSDVEGRAILKLSGQNRWSHAGSASDGLWRSPTKPLDERSGWLVEPVLPYSCRIHSTTVTGRRKKRMASLARRSRCWRMLRRPCSAKSDRIHPPVQEKHQASTLALMQQAQELIANEKNPVPVHSSPHTASPGHLRSCDRENARQRHVYRQPGACGPRARPTDEQPGRNCFCSEYNSDRLLRSLVADIHVEGGGRLVRGRRDCLPGKIRSPPGAHDPLSATVSRGCR